MKVTYFYIIFPCSSQYLSICSCILASSMLFIIFKLTVVKVSVCIFYLPSPTDHVVFKIANIGLINRVQVQGAIPMLFIIFKLPCIVISIGVYEFALAIKSSLRKHSIVLSSSEYIMPFTMLLVIKKLTFIFAVIEFILQYSFSLLFIFIKLPFVDSLFLVILQYASAMEFILKELSLVMQFMFQCEFAQAMLQSPLKLSVVDAAIAGSVDSFFEVVSIKLTNELVSILIHILAMHAVFLPILDVPIVGASVTVCDYAVNKFAIVECTFVSSIRIFPYPFAFRLVVFNITSIAIAIRVIKFSIGRHSVFKSAFEIAMRSIFQGA